MTLSPTTKRESGDPSLPREAYTLLAQANLLRMRGRWEEAVDKCMAALRLAPENASAQSLLGDIYENQGRLDDAVQWYRMALDVNPDSPADRLKLGRLLEAKQRALVAASFAGDYPPPAPAAPAPASQNSDRLLRWGAWLLALLTVLTVVLAGLAMSGGHRPNEPQVKAPPVILPMQDVNPPAQAATLPAADPSEQALLQALQQDAPLSAQNITPLSVQMDPRLGGATVTLLCPLPPAGVTARAALLHDALLALQAAGGVPTGRVASWTVRCLLPAAAPDAAPSLALVADTTPAALAALGPAPAAPSSAPLLTAFHNLWWSPSVPPDPAGG